MGIVNLHSLLSKNWSCVLYDFDMLICNQFKNSFKTHAQITKGEFLYSAQNNSIIKLPLDHIEDIEILEDYFKNNQGSITVSIVTKSMQKHHVEKSNSTFGYLNHRLLRSQARNSVRRTSSFSAPKKSKLIVSIDKKIAKNIVHVILWLRDILESIP